MVSFYAVFLVMAKGQLLGVATGNSYKNLIYLDLVVFFLWKHIMQI